MAVKESRHDGKLDRGPRRARSRLGSLVWIRRLAQSRPGPVPWAHALRAAVAITAPFGLGILLDHEPLDWWPRRGLCHRRRDVGRHRRTGQPQRGRWWAAISQGPGMTDWDADVEMLGLAATEGTLS